MASNQSVKLSRSFTCLKITQIIFNICVLGYSAYIVYYDPGSATIFSTVTPAFAILCAIYYFITARSQGSANWTVLLALEALTVLLWFVSTALWVWWEYYAVDGYREYILGDGGPTQVTAGVGDDPYDYDDYSRKQKRHDGKHEEFYADYTGDYSITYKWALGVFTTALALCFIGFVLYCVTLAMLASGIRRRRSTAGAHTYKY